MIRNHIKRLVFAALMLAAGMLLPLLIGQVQVLGQSFLPMHLPVLHDIIPVPGFPSPDSPWQRPYHR